MNFANLAGQGASALALELGVSAQEARKMIARFDRRYARARAFQDEQLRLARERGYIVTIARRALLEADRAMRGAGLGAVPLVVGVEAGPSWADLEPVPVA